MSEAENPYRSPEGDSPAIDAVPSSPPDTTALIRRGRLVFLGIVAIEAVGQVGFYLRPGTDPSLLGPAISGFLLLAAWRGYGGAIVVLALRYAISVLFSVIQSGVAFADGEAGLAIDAVVSGALGAALVLCLFRCRSLNAFFADRERRRTQPASDTMEGPLGEKLPAVTLTEQAAERVRDVIAEGEFAADTAVRISTGDRGGALYRIQYDLPQRDVNDWRITSQGLTVLVDQELAHEVDGLVVDYQHGAFTFGRTGV